MSSGRPAPLELEFEILAAPPRGERPAQGERTYLVRRKGKAARPVDIQWDAELQRNLEELKEPIPDRTRLAAIGERLGAFFSDELAEQILSASAERPVRIVISLQGVASEVGALPWEWTSLGASGTTLAALPHCSLRYEWAGAEPCPPQDRREGGRILCAYSTGGGGGIRGSQHFDCIRAACASSGLPFDEKDFLVEVSLSRLTARLEAAKSEPRGPYTILHLLCHGGPLPSDTSTYGLILRDDSQSPVTVDPAMLAGALRRYRDSLRLVVINACKGGDGGEPGNPMGSASERLHRVGIESVIAARFPLSVVGSALLASTFYSALLGRPCSVQEAFLAARNSLFDKYGDRYVDYASLQLWERGWDSRPVTFRPYHGLITLGPAQRRFFFGRDRETQEILDELDRLRSEGRPRFQIIEGASGSGKSSLVFAGVVPRLLERKPGWSWASMRPGADPQKALDAALQELAAAGSEGPQLLVVDQLEELFTQGSDDPVRHNAFVQRLWALASQSGGSLSILCTLRSDYRARCGDVLLEPLTRVETSPGRVTARRMDSLFAAGADLHNVFIPQMGPEQLREVIKEPAERTGLDLPGDLVDRILSEVGAEPGALPMVKHALDLLWRSRDGRRISPESYKTIGGVTGALNKHADQVLASLAQHGEGALKEARRILLQLVVRVGGGSPNTRRTVSLQTLRPKNPALQGLFEQVLARLVDERLLVRRRKIEDQEDSLADAIEVAHESLIRSFDTLQRWLKESEEEQLAAQRVRSYYEDATYVAMDETGTRNQEPLTGQRLGYARWVLEQFPDSLHPDVEAWIKSSLVKAEQERERRARTELDLQLRLAAIYEEQGRQQLAQRQPERALLWLNRAYQDTPEGHELASLRGLIYEALLPVRRKLCSIQGAHSAGAVALTPDHSRLLVCSRNAASLYYVRTAELLWEWRVAEGATLRLALSPDGRRLVASTTGLILECFDMQSGPPIHSVDLQGEELSALYIRSDSRSALIGTPAGKILRWDMEGASLLPAWSEPLPIRPLAITESRDGSRLLVRGRSLHTEDASAAPSKTSAIVLDARTGAVQLQLHAIRCVTFGRSEEVISHHDDGTLQWWTLGGATPRLVRTEQAPAELRSLYFNSDSQCLLGDSAGGIHRLNVGTGVPICPPEEYQPGLFRVLLSQDGACQAVVGFDGTLEARVELPVPFRTLQDPCDELPLVLYFDPAGVLHAVLRTERGIELCNLSTRQRHYLLPASRRIMSVVLHRARFQLLCIEDADCEDILFFDLADSERWAPGAEAPFSSLRSLFERLPADQLSGLRSELARLPGIEFLREYEEWSRKPDSLLQAWSEWQSGGTRPPRVTSALGEVAIAMSARSDRTLKGEPRSIAVLDSEERLGFAQPTDLAPPVLRAGLMQPSPGALSDDGKLLAVGSSSSQVEVWDVALGRRIRALDGYGTLASCLAFSPDGTQLAVAGLDGSLRLWPLAVALPSRPELAALVAKEVPFTFAGEWSIVEK